MQNILSFCFFVQDGDLPTGLLMIKKKKKEVAIVKLKRERRKQKKKEKRKQKKRKRRMEGYHDTNNVSDESVVEVSFSFI